MNKKFKDVEEEFSQLKDNFREKKISSKDFKAGLKKLRLKDGKGKWWTIGAQTGKWYYFDESNWIEANPPSIEEKKAICIYCGFENDLENEVCGHCGGNLSEKEKICPECGAKLVGPAEKCPHCLIKTEPRTKNKREVDMPFEEDESTHLILRSISHVSLFLFWGTIGLFIGIILGALAGATDFFSQYTRYLPTYILSFQGKLLGGIIYGLLGGVVGFIILGVIGFILSLIINMILSFIGGIKIKLSKII